MSDESIFSDLEIGLVVSCVVAERDRLARLLSNSLHAPFHYDYEQTIRTLDSILMKLNAR